MSGATPWKRVGIAVAALAVVPAGAMAWLLAGASAVRQPLAFSHKAHLAIEKPKVTCRSCHEGVETSFTAGAPTLRRCLSCHTDEGESPEERKLQTFAGQQRDIPWQRVWRLPPDVFFSHRQHVAVAAIECRTCHGDIAGLGRPLSRPVRIVTMADCIGCHARWRWPEGAPPARTARPVATDCGACHR